MDVRLIIIITSPFKKSDRFIPGWEWEDAWGFKTGKKFAYREDTTNVKYSEAVNQILNNQFPIIIWINSKIFRNEAGKNVQQFAASIKGIAEGIVDHINKSIDINEIRIACHDIPSDQYLPRELQKVAKAYSLAEGNERQFEKIIKTDQSGKKHLDALANFEDIFECFFLNIPKSLTLLKHRIAHLWLPLDIDLQGIREVSRQKSGSKSQDYLKAVLTSKKDEQFYRNKLAKLWYMVVHEPESDLDKKKTEFSQGGAVSQTCGDTKVSCETVPPREDAEALLADNKAILELIGESDKKEKVKEDCKKLLQICGLDYENSDPYNKSKIKAKPDSPILQFMCYLDCLVEKQNEIQDGEVENLFDKEKQLFEALSQELNRELPATQNKTQITTFHQWFVELEEVLDNLRKLV
ncbi:MAG: hypothetical protein J7K33_11295 [Candidatus Marinimicrobia bacterium]|nr:hypothetical protein [Candidatus Neomarinimicrobiota bacterium]